MPPQDSAPDRSLSDRLLSWAENKIEQLEERDARLAGENHPAPVPPLRPVTVEVPPQPAPKAGGLAAPPIKSVAPAVDVEGIDL